jgi:hypothetical protein
MVPLTSATACGHAEDAAANIRTSAYRTGAGLDTEVRETRVITVPDVCDMANPPV